SVRGTVAHTYAAEWAWYERWQGRSPTALLPYDQFADVASLRAAWTAHEVKMREYVGGLDEASVDRAIDYKLLSGAEGSTPLCQMLQHVGKHPRHTHRQGDT